VVICGCDDVKTDVKSEQGVRAACLRAVFNREDVVIWLL